ncbi:MAG: Glutamine--fructose-6-phosphate aminotransferase [isomerizing] [Alphaproteobacteria bacterium MarineAlpha9_Bin6]|nr:MAG: Glutamine--fructose-6-phosphate aminotransferase [isomerizing] [Alphaproteobacteria bacterium MarineAlpha9_Bin6]
MCGIIGAIANEHVTPLLLSALHRLEYRGYDSAGIATLVDGNIHRRRAEGKLPNLDALIEKHPLQGRIGIGHTRWATHGVPNTVNAHPHATEEVALVHNGIIENFLPLRAELMSIGHAFETETDSEVVLGLIHEYLHQGMSPQGATAEMLKRVDGAFALGIIFAGHDDLLIGARRGCPLVVGYGEGEMFLGSDALALASLTERITYLEEGDWVEVRRDGVSIHETTGQIVERQIRVTSLSDADVGKGNYQHFMLKEIYEQPAVIGDCLHSLFNPVERTVSLPDTSIDFSKISRLNIVACGTSYYAGLVARYWFEEIADLPVDIDVASEYRYRKVPVQDGVLGLFISQSGETADTVAALRFAREKGQTVLSVVNAVESSMSRESDGVLHTLAGPEIGVASTKAFTTQLVTLASLAIAAGRARGVLERVKEEELASALIEVPSRAAEILNHDEALRNLAEQIYEVRDVLYIGRGTSYAVALEGALKLKEISYIHAEAYAAGELKHGPIALIDDGVPVIVIAPSDGLFEKTASNMQEVVARGGRVILMSDADGVSKLGRDAFATVTLPDVSPFVTPILYAIPVQLLAYHVAVLKGTDIDQPRNLAKSVTVE